VQSNRSFYVLLLVNIGSHQDITSVELRHQPQMVRCEKIPGLGWWDFFAKPTLGPFDLVGKYYGASEDSHPAPCL
jgi:hypothetical protein